MKLRSCARVLIPPLGRCFVRISWLRVMSLVGYMLQFTTSNCRMYVEISPRYTVSRGGARARGRCEATQRVADTVETSARGDLTEIVEWCRE